MTYSIKFKDGTSKNFESLRNANLRDADLSGIDLKYVDLRGADLRMATFQHSDLRHADLRGTDLRCADLQYADLQHADLQSADLRGADLREADLGFSCFPLWCGSSDLLVDEKLPLMLSAFICSMKCENAEIKELQELIKPYALKSHKARHILGN